MRAELAPVWQAFTRLAAREDRDRIAWTAVWVRSDAAKEAARRTGRTARDVYRLVQEAEPDGE